MGRNRSVNSPMLVEISKIENQLADCLRRLALVRKGLYYGGALGYTRKGMSYSFISGGNLAANSRMKSSRCSACEHPKIDHVDLGCLNGTLLDEQNIEFCRCSGYKAKDDVKQ